MARRDQPPAPSSVARHVLRFVLAGGIALVLVLVGSIVVSRQAGTGEAIRDSRNDTRIIAYGIVRPELTDALLDGDPTAVAALDEAVRTRVLDEDLVRVKVWSRDGTIVYSDEQRLIGSRYRLGDEELESFDHPHLVEAEVSDLGKPENRFERGFGKLLEVYLPVRTTQGTPVLFEAYFRYDTVTASARRINRQFLPIMVGGLVLLQVLQLPLAGRLARRVRRGQQEREALLRHAVDASDLERRQIAADLHDGVVQQLAGVSYALAGLADSVGKRSEPELASVLDAAAADTRHSIQSLRSLLVEIYPPNLRELGLEAALTDLVASAASRGIATEVHVDTELAGLRPETEALLFRAAQEGVRNAVRHAKARRIAVTVRRLPGTAQLEVTDDGVGFDTDHAPEAHFGLRLLRDLAHQARGSVDVRSAPGSGTVLRMEVPA